MTFSQRKNSSGSKRLFSYIPNIGSSNETLVLKDNMETNSHSSIDTNKSDDDNLLSMGTLLQSEDTTLNISNLSHSLSNSKRKECNISIIHANGNTFKKYNKGHKKSISIDIQNIKRNILDQTSPNSYRIPYSATSPRVVHSAPSNSPSQCSVFNNNSIGNSNNYKHRSYTNGYTFNSCQNYSNHSSIYNIPTYSVTPNNVNSSPSYNTSASINNNNNLMSSPHSTLSYNNSNNINSNINTAFSNTTLNNQSSSLESANTIANHLLQEPVDRVNEKHNEEDEDTPLNFVASADSSAEHDSLDQINDLSNYRGTEEDDIFNSTDMYLSSRIKHRKQKSFYKRLLNQGGEHRHQIHIDEDYLDIKREDTQLIHDLFQKSISSKLTLHFKDAYTEICYNRYINNKYINFWKKSTIILAIVVLITQMMILINDLSEKDFKLLITKVASLDILGLVIPVIVFYYLIYRLRSRILAKAVPYLVNTVLIFMGPITLLGSIFLIKSESKNVLLLAYISFFFVSHSLLFSCFIPSIFSTSIFCISWIIAVIIKKNMGENWYAIILEIMLFILISSIVVYSLYKKERSSRRQFMNEQRLMRINSKLVSQLNRIERGFANEAADLDAPIEKAIITIRSLMASPTIGPEHLKALGMVLCYLQVPNLFAPDLDQQVTQGLKMDDERKKWLFSEVAHRKQIERSKHSSSSESSSGAGSLSPFYTPSPSIHDPQTDYQIINIDNYLTNHSAELLTKINDYNFPVFEYFKSTTRPLLTMSYHIFVKSGLLGRLHLSVNQFLNFMSAVEDGYHPEHQFHNAEHASDVLHCIYYFSTIPNIATCFKDLDYLGMYMAACIHDFDHPGVSNKFLITAGDPLAELYNDKSVLENHHCSAALKLLNKPGNNFIERLDKEKKRELRETIIELVLATDLSGHFSYLTSFKKKLLDTLTCNTREDRLLLMQMMIKCCDVSNPTKSRNIYKEWIHRVMSEFFTQGDKEKQLNMPVSPFCNRDNANAYSCQKGFIDFVAAPIFEAVGEYILKFQVGKNSSQKQIQITNTNNSSNNNISKENSIKVTNENSLISNTSVTEVEKKNAITSLNDENANTNNISSQRQSKTHHHKKTFSKFNLQESQIKANVILDGLKSNKEWIDSNAAKTESSS